MRFSEGFFAAHIAAPYVAYQPRESSVRGQIAFRTPSSVPELRPAAGDGDRLWRLFPRWEEEWTASLLLDDPNLYLGMHIRVQPDHDPVDAKRPNRLVQLDLALLDRESLGLELVGNI